MSNSAVIQEGGRIQIPEIILQELGWEPGILLQWEKLDNEELRLVAAEPNFAGQNSPRLTRKNGHWVVPAQSNIPLKYGVDEAREERIQELLDRN